MHININIFMLIFKVNENLTYEMHVGMLSLKCTVLDLSAHMHGTDVTTTIRDK